MKTPRKLFRKDLLIQMTEEHVIGVPISAIRRKYHLSCSDPHLRKHIDYYLMFKDREEVIASLFPIWLNDICDTQEVNDELYKYKGLFPWGEWLTK